MSSTQPPVPATDVREVLILQLVQDAIDALHPDVADDTVEKFEREMLHRKFSARLTALTPPHAVAGDVRAVLTALKSKVYAKQSQLEYYRDHDCQIDHARPIATGRIDQITQIMVWLDEALAAPAPTVTTAFPAALSVETITREDVAREILFDYINYRGEKSHRRARPISTRFGTSEWHQKPQWLMLAIDLARNEEREFAMADMTNVVEMTHGGGSQSDD